MPGRAVEPRTEWALRPSADGDVEAVAELRAVVVRPDFEDDRDPVDVFMVRRSGARPGARTGRG